LKILPLHDTDVERLGEDSYDSSCQDCPLEKATFDALQNETAAALDK
jgi:hypothetical protein